MAKDVKMMYIDDDIKKIQTKTNMYIREYGVGGVFHITKEVIQNLFDEGSDPNSPCDEGVIEIDEGFDECTVTDNGRGFPEKDYHMEIFCTKLQSGSKFTREQSGSTSGEFGVGITCTNALSEYFSIRSYRDMEDYMHFIEFKEGVKFTDEKRKINKGEKRHGVEVKFKPSKRYLGANAHLDYDMITEWLELQCYLIKKGIKKIKVIRSNRGEVQDTMTLKKKPFRDLLDTMTPSDGAKSSVISFDGERKVKETIMTSNITKSGKEKVEERVVEKDLLLEVAMCYVSEPDTVYDTFCNFTNTKEGGVHQKTVEECFCRFMQSKAKETQTDAQREKYKITWDDIKTGLNCIINLDTGAQVGFVGNAKEKINNTALVPIMADIVNTEINKFFETNPKVLTEFINIIKMNAKSRVDALKIRDAVKKERMDSLKENEMKNYIRCKNTGKKYKELHLVEGDSASGSAVDGSDRTFQAFLMFRGVVANCLKCSLAEIMENKEWSEFVKICRAGVGPTFDISKLFFDKIIIMTDADIDGSGIASGMITFIYMYMRPAIEEGRVYRAVPPLYKLDDKEHQFVTDKKDLAQLFHKKISKVYKIREEFSDNYMTKGEFSEFLEDSYDYADALVQVAENSGRINKFLVEAVIATLTMSGHVRSSHDYDNPEDFMANQEFITRLMTRIQELFPEIRLNGRTLSGPINGSFSSIKVTERFIGKCEELIPVTYKYGHYLYVSEKGREERKMTIGEFLDDASKYKMKILLRYKGLGEMNADQLGSTTIDPNNRTLIQLTTDDAKKEVEIFRKLHGTSVKDKKARKKMMKQYKLKRDDLDN